jgi:NAD(P)-dependent dehydrogenase (short-subunit alcohol dehydrogenase family)
MTRDDHDAPPKRPDEPIEQPIPPYPEQRQRPPGLESELEPAPRWRGERYKSADKLAGMVALITGGDSGIGRSVAYLFAREGADVAITALPEEASDADVTQKAIEALGRRCIVFEGDLSDATYCDRVVEETEQALGRLDVLVHNAAWQNRKRITELTEDELDRTLKVNVPGQPEEIAPAFVFLASNADSSFVNGSMIVITGGPV